MSHNILQGKVCSHKISHWDTKLNWICHFNASNWLRCKVWKVVWYAVIFIIFCASIICVSMELPCVIPTWLLWLFDQTLFFIVLIGFRLVYGNPPKGFFSLEGTFFLELCVCVFFFFLFGVLFVSWPHLIRSFSLLKNPIFKKNKIKSKKMGVTKESCQNFRIPSRLKFYN